MHVKTSGVQWAFFLYCIVTSAHHFLKLRRTFRVVQAIKNVSGWTWSDETGASITPELEDSWASYVRLNKDAKPFKHKGWRHFHRMENIMPGTIRGAYVFRASDATVGAHPQPVVVDDDSLPPFHDDESAGESQATSEGTQITWADTQPPLVATQEDAAAPIEDSGSSSQGFQGTPDNDVSNEDEEIRVTQVSLLTILFGLHLMSMFSQLVVTTPRRPKKRSALAPLSVNTTNKKTKLTGASALEGLTTSLSQFSTVVGKAFAPPPTESEVGANRREKAVIRAQELETWMSTSDLLAFVNILEKDMDAVTTYLALKGENFRKVWVQDKIDRAIGRFEV